MDTPLRPWRTRLRRVVFWGALAVLVVPPLQCLLLTVVDPPLTGTMLSRALRHRWQEDEWRWPERTWVDLADLPAHVARAAVASEDRGFVHHRGFDWGAIRGAWRRYQDGSGKRLAGGSTISQQVARNVFLWQHRSWLRKGLEAWYTVWLEVFVSKRRILEVYVNIAELGPMVFGVEAAAQHWYRQPARTLRPEQAARLIAILPAPNRWTPTSAPAVRRADWIARNPVRRLDW